MGRLNFRGFTLIETIITVGITGLILPVIFAIVFVIIQQQTKIIRLQEVKRQGDFVFSNMKTTIRNSAIEIYSDSSLVESNLKCNDTDSSYDPVDSSNFYFKDKIGNWFRYSLSSDKISSASSTTPAFYLTNDKVKISDFLISCHRQNIYSRRQ